MRHLALSVLTGGSLLLVLAAPAAAKTLFVANNGVDTGICGTPAANPCRSISQAIANAAAGDKITVGPGVYGDVDGDGAFTSPGDESGSVGAGADRMIVVDKRLQITSRDGARATLLRSVPGFAGALVRIAVDQVVFGKKNKGFTLLGDSGATTAVEVDPVSGVTVAGNVATRHATAFLLQGAGHVAADNEALENAEFGILATGAAHRVEANAARGSGLIGILLFRVDDTTVKGNVATGNGVEGIGATGGTGNVFERNAAISNGGTGITIVFDLAPGDTSAEVTRNSIFANDPNGNCGFTNGTGAPLDVAGNFWGVSGGPGADPGDAVCNLFASTTTVSSVAAKEIKVLLKPQR